MNVGFNFILHLCLFTITLCHPFEQLTTIINQCNCATLQPCINRMQSALSSCMTVFCPNNRLPNISAIINQQIITKCIHNRHYQLLLLRDCITDYFNQKSICINDLNKTMHASTAVTTIIDDILAILIARKSAILHTMLDNPMTYIVDEFKQYGRCISACVEIESDYCFRKQSCSLQMPSQPEIMLDNDANKCLINSGFDDNDLANICDCIVDNGIREIQPICSLLKLYGNPLKTQSRQQQDHVPLPSPFKY